MCKRLANDVCSQKVYNISFRRRLNYHNGLALKDGHHSNSLHFVTALLPVRPAFLCLLNAPHCYLCITLCITLSAITNYLFLPSAVCHLLDLGVMDPLNRYRTLVAYAVLQSMQE